MTKRHSDGKRFVVRVDKKLTAFVELESAIRFAAGSGRRTAWSDDTCPKPPVEEIMCLRNQPGNNPFTSTLPGGYYDLTTPNPVYWSHVDYIVQTAAANGLQCVFTPLDQGGWTQTSLRNGTNRCYQYGQFLGNRYKNSPNIIWNLGNDFQNWATQQNDAVILAIADGIERVDTNHLMTIELNFMVSESQDDPNWISRITANGVYTFYPTYDETLVAYNKPNIMPVLFLEEHYEYENVGGEFGTPNVLRRQEYWSLTSGALAGHMYGNHYTWTFTSGWQYLQTTGTRELMYFRNFFFSRKWYNLIPDQSHTLLTAGYGTYTPCGNVSDSDYSTARYCRRQKQVTARLEGHPTQSNLRERVRKSRPNLSVGQFRTPFPNSIGWTRPREFPTRGKGRTGYNDQIRYPLPKSSQGRFTWPRVENLTPRISQACRSRPTDRKRPASSIFRSPRAH